MANLVYDTFIVKEKYQLSSTDLANLTNLYLPLMGIDSYSLYHIFTNIGEGKEYTFKYLLDLLPKLNLKDLNLAIDKLEAMGLLSKFEKKDSPDMFICLPPLSQDDFLGDLMLRQLLIGAIGQDQVCALEKKDTLDGYKDVTKKFDEVFTISTVDVPKTIKKTFGVSLADNTSFNYSLFKAYLEDEIDDAVLSDSEFEAKIRRLAFTYKLSVEEAKECVLKSIRFDNSMEYADFARYAVKIFSAKHASSSPHIAVIEDNEFLESISDDAIQTLLYSISGMSYSDCLKSITKGNVAVSEISMLDKIQTNFGFSHDVINVMLLGINGQRNGDIPGYAYFEKVASQMVRANVHNAYDALKYFEKQKNQAHASRPNSYVREVPLPRWYEEYRSSLSKTTEVEITEEVKNETLDFMREFFKDE